MLCSQDDEDCRSSGADDQTKAREEELQQTEYCDTEQGGELSEEEEMEEDEDEEEEDDGEGWITPSNLKQVQLESGDWTAPADIKVGCLTTDFAMQVI